MKIGIVAVVSLLAALRLGAADAFKPAATVRFDDVKNEWRFEVESNVLHGESTLRFHLLTALVVGVLRDKEKTWDWFIELSCSGYPEIEEIVIKGCDEKPKAERLKGWTDSDGYAFSRQRFPLASTCFAEALKNGFQARIYDSKGYKDAVISKAQFTASAELARNISAGRIKKEREQTVQVANGRQPSRR